MNSFTEGILTGLSSGALIGGLAWLSRSVIYPKLMARLQRVPSINGNWEFVDLESDEVSGVAKIVQVGAHVTMEVTRNKNRKGKDSQRVFLYKGQFSSGQLVLVFSEKGGAGFITGASVLSLSTNRSALSGYTLFYDFDEGRVTPLRRELRRKS